MAIQTQSFSPWLSIWTSPRATVRRIVDTAPTKNVLLLAAISGVGRALDRASSQNAGDALPMAAILGIAVVFGPIGGIVSLHIGGALLRWTGGWLGGQGTAEQVRAAIAWSLVPTILGSLLWLPELALLGEEMFTEATPVMDANPILADLLLGMIGIEVALAIWSVAILILALGEVHRFSGWRALASMVLAFLVVFIPILCIVGGIVVLAGLAG